MGKVIKGPGPTNQRCGPATTFQIATLTVIFREGAHVVTIENLERLMNKYFVRNGTKYYPKLAKA